MLNDFNTYLIDNYVPSVYVDNDGEEFTGWSLKKEPGGEKMAKYKNLSYKPRNYMYGEEYYETNVTPVRYRGFLIYHRLNFDIVKGGLRISECAGLNGAKARIDQMIDKPETVTERERRAAIA